MVDIVDVDTFLRVHGDRSRTIGRGELIYAGLGIFYLKWI